MLVSLPMYGVELNDVEQFWQALRDKLAASGLGSLPPTLEWPQPLLEHWQQADLLLSQTCGFPLVEFLPQVQLVGTFNYSAPGCNGPYYRSFLVVRAEDSHATLADFRGRTVAFNSTDSQSGFNSLRALIAPLAENGNFFGDKLETGGHRYSLAAVQHGRADIAAIDCVTLELLRRYVPQEVEGLSIIGETAAAPGLPLITSASSSPEVLTALRQAVAQTIADPNNQGLCEKLLINGFTVLPREEYQVILQMKDAALQLGVSQF